MSCVSPMCIRGRVLQEDSLFFGHILPAFVFPIKLVPTQCFYRD